MRLYAVFPFILQLVAWPFAHFILRVFGTLKIEGFENIKDLNGPIIFAANHVNDLDPVLTRALIPPISKFAPLFWVSRTQEYYDNLPEELQFKGWQRLLYGDWFFEMWGSYPAYKGTGDYEQSLKHHIRLLKNGNSVCIFPQGGKAKEQGRGAQIHGGVAFLSRHTNVPVVPVGISGTKGIDVKKLFFGDHNIQVCIGKPMKVKTVEYKEEAKKIVAEIYNLIDGVVPSPYVTPEELANLKRE